MAVCRMGLVPCLAGGRVREETELFLNAQDHVDRICAQYVGFLIREMKLKLESKLRLRRNSRKVK